MFISNRHFTGQRNMAARSIILFLGALLLVSNCAVADIVGIAGDGEVYSVSLANGQTGFLSTIDGIDGNTHGVAFASLANDSRGDLYGIDRISRILGRLDLQQGTAITVHQGAGPIIDHLDFDGSDNLFGISTVSGGGGEPTRYSLWTIGVESAAYDRIGLEPIGSIQGMAFDDTGTLYGVDRSSGADQLVTISTLTGQKTLIGDLGRSVSAIAFDSDSASLFGFDDSNFDLLEINRSNGNATTVGTFPADVAPGIVGMASLTAIPEPSSIMGLVTLALAVLLRRRRYNLV